MWVAARGALLSVVPVLGLIVAGCATAGGGPASSDADPNAPDADPNAPDADPTAPDARVNPPGPDAATSPDAMVTPMDCTLVPNAGCPAGQACDLDGAELATGGTECRAVTAPGMDLDTCTGVTTCAAGWTCLGPTVSTSQCYEWCSVDSNCTPPGGLCVIQVVYGTPPMDVPGAKTCSKNCDPLNSTGCPATWGCHPYQEAEGAMRFFTHCDSPGPGGQNATCTYDSDCQQNFSCINTGGPSPVCLHNCRVTPPSSGCAGIAGTSCVGFTTPVVIGGVEYGVCF